MKERRDNSKFAESIDFLESLFSIEKAPDDNRKKEAYNLDFMRELMEKLDNPQYSYPVIHITGTNGKGSTAMYTERLLREHGLKTGLYTSPHTCTVRERIQINGSFISEDDFAELINELKVVINERDGGIRTYFEFLTTAAFIYFARKKVDVAIIEVGLGGRLDATNVCKSDIALIANIGIDHIKTLGNSKSDILKEKLGILKEKSKLTIIHDEDNDDIVDEYCNALGVEYSYEDEIDIEWESDYPYGGRLKIKNFAGFDQIETSLALNGEFQKKNVALALSALEKFSKFDNNNLSIDESKVKYALRNVFMPARAQLIAEHPNIIVDGGHNEAAIEINLKNVISYSKGRIRIVYSGMADKDLRNIMKVFDKYAEHIDRVTFTTIDNIRSVTLNDLRKLSRNLDISTRYIDISFNAMMDSAEDLEPNDCILVCGSFYLIAEILEETEFCRKYLRDNKFSSGMAQDYSY